MIKFPPPRDGKGVKCPGYAWGGGMLKLRFDRYIMEPQHLVLTLEPVDETPLSCTLTWYYLFSVLDEMKFRLLR